MNASRTIQLVVYLAAALLLGYHTLRSIMWGVWGAPVYPTHYIALFGALVLFAGAFFSLGVPNRGRIVGLAGLFGLGVLWIPGVVTLVPRHNLIISPMAYAAFLLYFATMGFALLYPQRWKWSVPAFVVVLCIAAGFVGVTAVARFRDGEYARPSFAFFRWHPGGESLVVGLDPDGWIDSQVRTLLEQAGIRGRLECTGGSGGDSNARRVILLAQRQPSSRYELHYPREGVLIYAYDGAQWRVIPDGAATFSSFATIVPQNSATMLWQDAGSGRWGTTAFTW